MTQLKSILIILGLVFMSTESYSKDDAIQFFKEHPKVKSYLENKPHAKYWVKYDEIELGEICGFAGCQWRKLVAMTVTSKSANAPSDTFFAIVEGPVPVAKDAEPTIRFVDLTDMPPSKWSKPL
ncbi:hypothetical protein [Pleionea sediminis]|uniref:hypothetical protein n=1 Tax=Pleionea sediminis TaxID=2569479 RepID=UPI0011870C46|nr:hypothetical protein [Pleionea sediminis]